MFENLSTRRIFLQKGLTLLAVAPTVPAFLDHTVMALADPLDSKRTQQPSGKDGKILVVVQLSGGNDGLNMIVPYADDAYHRARPVLGIKATEALKIDNYVGLHPNMAPLKAMYDAGNMAVVQGVGYPNPNRSHFRSMDIWQSAQPEKDLVTNGWLGRYFDNTCQGEDPHCGVCMGETLPLAMKGDRITPLSFEKPESYRYNGKDHERYLDLNKSKKVDAFAEPATQPAAKRIIAPKRQPIVLPENQLEFLTRTAMDAQMSSDQILKVTRNHQVAAQYPNGEFGNGLRTVAAMIAGGLPTRVYYVTLGGFDTHAGQRARHDQLMTQLGAGLDAFWKDLVEQGNDQRVLVMTFSEFGRRVEQNASQGTDHGAAAPVMLFGKSIKQGLLGKHPSLTDLDQGDLKYNLDFRCVYASILQNWLETPSKPILGQQFQTMNLFKT